jgi:octaheme c-type cytochrome (tetrathionate reductase family)
MSCQECHKTEDHKIKGTALVVTPGPISHMDCIDCHTEEVHNESILNGHTDTVACQTCHIPAFAKEFPTKVFWDWSTAGEDREPETDNYGMHTYHKKKGNFKWEKNIVPDYQWFNGTGGAYLLGDKIDPEKVTKLNWPNGDIKDRKAKIHPFKVHNGKQIYDKKNDYFIAPKLFGKGGYWKTYSWDNAAQLGMKSVDLPYSGKYGFARTEMNWRINHMVAPKEQALSCLECHGDNSRLDWKALGYNGDPLRSGGRDSI